MGRWKWPGAGNFKPYTADSTVRWGMVSRRWVNVSIRAIYVGANVLASCGETMRRWFIIWAFKCWDDGPTYALYDGPSSQRLSIWSSICWPQRLNTWSSICWDQRLNVSAHEALYVGANVSTSKHMKLYMLGPTSQFLCCFFTLHLLHLSVFYNTF